jgi:hypothetical protein
LHRSYMLINVTADAGGMLYQSTLSLNSTQSGQFLTATVDLDNLILPIATNMPDGGASSASKNASPPRTSSTSQTTINPASNGKDGAAQTQSTRSSSNDREKMSEYVAFVDAQAEECCERLKNEVERASRGG